MSGEAAPNDVVERRTIGLIPLDERHGRGSGLFTIWFGCNLQLLTVFTGVLATAAFGLSFFWAIVAVLVGNLGGGIFMALHAAQGPRMGVPQMVQTRAQFGIRGAVLVVAIAIFMYVGFTSANLVLAGGGTHVIIHSLSPDAGIVIAVVAALGLAALGHDVLHAVARWTSWAGGVAVVAAFVFMFIVEGVPSSFLDKGGFSGGPFLAMVSVAAVWQIAYAPYVADYSRYLPPSGAVGSRQAFWWSYAGCTIGSAVPMILGAAIGLATAEPDTATALDSLTGSAAFPVVLLMTVGLWVINALNLYCTSLCLINIGEAFKARWIPGPRARFACVVVVSAVTAYIALTASSHFLTDYENFLLLLLYVLVPWTAINLVDYYSVRRGNYDVEALFDSSGGRYGLVNWVTMAVYFVGIAVQIPFVSNSLYTGPLVDNLGGADVAWIIGLVVTAPVYYVVARRRGADVVSVSPDGSADESLVGVSA